MYGTKLSVVVTAENGNEFESDETDPVDGDLDAPEIVDAEVVDAWTLEVEFDEDIFEGDDFAVTVSLGGTEIDVDTDIDGTTLKITKDDASSFVAGTYTITITDVEDEYGNASEEDLEAEVTKDNSYAVGFNAYEGYVAEYDLLNQTNALRYVHVTVTDQYGEEMDSALSSTYGTVKVKAYIKSNDSIIGATFNKSGAQSTVDDRDMAYVTLTADKDFKAGETVVIELNNKVDGIEYTSEMEVEILEYDLVQTAQEVTELTVTTDKNADISKTWTDDGESGSMDLSSNNKVFLIASAIDSNGDAARKGNIKFVSSDPTVVKVGTLSGAKFGETAITGKGYDTDGTAALVAADENVFGIWIEGQKEGTATITAYATGFIDKAYTFDVTVNGATLAISDALAYSGEMCYFPITLTNGVKHSDLTTSISALYIVDEDGDETAVTPLPADSKYLGTASAKDKDLGLKEGVSYLTLDMSANAAHDDQVNYKAIVSVNAGTIAKSEETEVTISPRIEVDSSKAATSGIHLGTEKGVTADALTGYAAATAAVGVTANNTNSDDSIFDTTTAGYKNKTVYKSINVINTTPIQIGNYAAKEIKYTWSDDTKGTAKVNISKDWTETADNNVLSNALAVAGTALLAITPKTDELIGTLTLSIGGATKDIEVKLGKTAAAGSMEVKLKDGKKAVLIDAASTADIVDGNANHQVTLKIKDQYGNGAAGLAFNDATVAGAGTAQILLKDAAATTSTSKATINNEFTIEKKSDAGGTYTFEFDDIYPGTHTLTFYVGTDPAEIDEDDPQVSVDITFVQKKDITSVEIQDSVKYKYTNGATNFTEGKYPNAATEKVSDEAEGVNFGVKYGATPMKTEITPEVKAFAGDMEVAGVVYDWTHLDHKVSFTESWEADETAHTAAGSQEITLDNDAATNADLTNGNVFLLTPSTGAITIDPNAKTNKKATLAAATVAGSAVTGTTGRILAGFVSGTTTWTDLAGGTAGDAVDATTVASATGTIEISDNTLKANWSDAATNTGWTLDNIAAIAKVEDAGDNAPITGYFHLNVTVAGTAIEDEAYIHVSNEGNSISVDDMYLAYQAKNEDIGVSAGDKVGDALKVKAGSFTKIRVCAVDTTFGATLYNEPTGASGAFVVDSTNADAVTGTNGLIVGTDTADVEKAAGYTYVKDGIVYVYAAVGSTGKSASLRLPVTDGSKTRFITVPLEIID